MFNIVLENGPEIQRRLSKLGTDIEQRVVTMAMYKAWRIVLAAVKQKARALHRGQSGRNMASQLAASVEVEILRGGRYGGRLAEGVFGLVIQHEPSWPGFVTYGKGAKSSLKTKRVSGGKRYYIPAAIEYGHAFPGRGRGGRKGAPKDVAARAYMKPAFEATKDRVIAVITQEIHHGLEIYGR
jgi:hypothetical protein